jgi:hypothetical protein
VRVVDGVEALFEMTGCERIVVTRRGRRQKAQIAYRDFDSPVCVFVAEFFKDSANQKVW